MDNFNSDNNLSQVAKIINEYKNEDIKVTVIGHTQIMKDKEESYDTYENRLIYTLIQNMKFFLSQKKKIPRCI